MIESDNVERMGIGKGKREGKSFSCQLLYVSIESALEKEGRLDAMQVMQMSPMGCKLFSAE